MRDVRSLVRDNIRATLPGADASIPNSVLRVLSDVQGGLCHLTLQYLDWLALQLLPDTAEAEWLDRHADIWLVNSDSTIGRKMATLATGTAEFTGTDGTIVPLATQLLGVGQVEFETIEEITVGTGATPAAIRALDPGSASNLEGGTQLTVTSSVPGLDSTATVVVLSGGTDTETDEDLRYRVLQRIRNQPQGGSAQDYVRWALAVPGVTRAWAATEMGIGTVTVRFMMDELRESNDGFPLPEDIDAVTAYLDTVRPVAVKDLFVEGPIPVPVDFIIDNLVEDTEATRNNIEESCRALFRNVAPGQTIYGVAKSAAVLNAVGVVSFNLVNVADDVMPSVGHMGKLGDIVYV